MLRTGAHASCFFSFLLVPYRTLARVGLICVDCLAICGLRGTRRALAHWWYASQHTRLQRVDARAAAALVQGRCTPQIGENQPKASANKSRASGAPPAPSIKQSKSTALRAGATFTVGCARPAAPITQRIHPRSSGGQEFGECSRSCVGRSCRVAPVIPRPPAPNSTSFKGSAVGRPPCWEITLGLTLLRTGMLR